jgi:type I restriction enzyme M protein
MQSQLPFMPTDKEHLDISALETWLWDAACIIRGAMDAPKFKDFILPLIFYKRLSDVFDDEFAEYVVQYGDETVAHEVIKADHEDALKTNRKPIVRFYIPGEYSWQVIRKYTELCVKTESGILNWQTVHTSSYQEDTNGSYREHYRSPCRKSRSI